MIEYHKIDTLFERDLKTFKVKEGEYKQDVYKMLKNIEWVWTEKIDGTNIRVMFDGVSVKFNGRTDNAQLPMDLIEHLQTVFTVDKMKAVFPEANTVCLYGEGFGAGIQKSGGLYSKTKSFILFDVLIGDIWLHKVDVDEIGARLECPVVPVVCVSDITTATERVKNGFNSIFGNFKAEGLVGKPVIELKTRMGKRIITKIKTKDF